MTFQELDSYMHEPKPQEYRSFTEAELGADNQLFQQGQISVHSDELQSIHQGAFSALRIVPNLRYSAVEFHRHDFFELMYVYKGVLVHHVAGEAVTLREADVILFPPGTGHSVEAAGAEDLAISVILPIEYFTPDVLSRMARLECICAFLQKHHRMEQTSDYLLWRGNESDQLRLYANSFLCEYFDFDRYSSAALDASLLLFLTALERLCPVETPSQQWNIHADMDRILEYIQQNFATVSLQELSNRFGYSENYLSRAIKARVGTSFKDFRHRQCMLQSAFLLGTTDYSVRQIAGEVGLSNLTFFYKLFHRYYGTSPAEFREKCQKTDE